VGVDVPLLVLEMDVREAEEADGEEVRLPILRERTAMEAAICDSAFV
jgi:hypothetical protein